MRSLCQRRRVVLSLLVVAAVGSSGCPGPRQPPQSPDQAKATTAIRPKHPFQALSADGWKTVEEEEEMDLTIPPYDPRFGAGQADQLKAAFRGKDRSGAKTSIVADAAIEPFASVAELQSQLPDDDAMLNHDPEITRQSMKRVQEEQRMVHVDAWIYAIKYESDNDWHVITGTDPDGQEIHYFNAEVSGLPKSSSPAIATLRKVRQSLAAILENDLPGPGSYRKYDPPIAVTIEGAMFYDVDHKPGAVGPGDMKPTTAWEIHPITSLVER